MNVCEMRKLKEGDFERREARNSPRQVSAVERKPQKESVNVELLSGPTEKQRRVLQVELRMQRGTKGKRFFPIGEERESVPVDFRSHL